jgi:hypothetical protein
MSRRIGLMLIGIAAFASVFASADNAEARHRRGRGSCGSWGGNGSFGGGGSSGGFFSRRNNGSWGSQGSYGGNGSHGGGHRVSNGCGSHGGSYQVVEEGAPQSASIDGSQGETRYYGQRDETYDSGQSSRTRIEDRQMRAGAEAGIGVERSDARDRGFNERREIDARGERQDLQGERQDRDASDSQRTQGEQRSTDNGRQSQGSRDTGQDSNQNLNQNQNENRDRNDNQQPPPPPSGT